MSLLSITSNYSLLAPLEEPKTTATIQRLPAAILIEVFKFLSIEGLGRSSCVCKTWHNLEYTASYKRLWENMDLTRVLPIIKIDKLFWETHVHVPCEELGIDPSGAPEPTQSKKGVKLLKALCDRVEDKRGLIDFTIPRGLCEKVLQKLKAPSCYWLYQQDLDTTLSFEEEVISKTHRVFITHNCFKDSSELSKDQQKALLNQTRGKTPNAIAVAALIILGSTTFFKDFEFLVYRGCIGQDNYTITYEDTENGMGIVVTDEGSGRGLSPEKYGAWAMIEASDVF